jgi:hypothetical protein
MAILYLLISLLVYSWLGFLFLTNQIILPIHALTLFLSCGVVGALGCIMYLLRSVYLHASVFKDWDNGYITWYILRPIVAFLCGMLSCLILKAGLLMFQTDDIQSDSIYGYLLFSVVAGYNVDNFLKLCEGKFKTTFGIKESRLSKEKNVNE